VAALTATTQSVTAAASLKGPLPIAVNLAGTSRQTPHPDGSGSARIDAELTRLVVAYPGTEWKNQGPAQLALDQQAVALSGFRLQAGPQTIAAELQKDARALVADLRIQALRLEALPGMGAARVAGLLDATVKATGTPEAPRVQAEVAVRDGRFDRYRGVSANLSATVSDGEDRTIAGTARAALGPGRLEARFRGPATWPAPDAPLALTLDVRDVAVSQLALPAGSVAVDGLIGLHLDLQGSAADPRLALQVAGKGLTMAKPGQAPEEGARPLTFSSARVAVTYRAPALAGRVALVDATGGSLQAVVRTRIPASARAAPATLALGTRRIAGSLHLQDMRADGLSALVPTLKVVRGLVSGAFAISGTVADPDVGGELGWREGNLVLMRKPSDPARGRAQ
jgi:hypothetical protein